MTAKHTPEPFSVSGIAGDNHVMARIPSREGPRKVTVAIVLGWPGITPQEHAANKALFRAAPELLAALEDVELRCTQATIASKIGRKSGQFRAEFLRSELDRISQAARTAITKATQL